MSIYVWFGIVSITCILAFVVILRLKRPSSPASTSLIVGSPEAPLIEFTRLPANYDFETEDIPINDDIRNTLAPILQQAPTLAMNAGQAMANTYILKFSPDVTKALSDGTAYLANAAGGGVHAYAIKDGQILGQGTLHSLRPELITAVAWQVLAVITAQKFLSDINDRLQNIERGIDKILGFLYDERKGKLIGNYKYLVQLKEQLYHHVITETDCKTAAIQIETIIREGSQTKEACELAIDRAINKIKDMKLDQHSKKAAIMKKRKYLEPIYNPIECIQDFIPDRKLKDIVNDLKKELDTLKEELVPYFMSLQVIAFANMVKCALPVSRALVMQRVEDLRKNLREKEVWLEKQHEALRKYIGTLKGLWSKAETNAERRSELIHDLSTSLKPIQEQARDLKAMIARIEGNLNSQIEEYKRPVQIQLSLNEKGEISHMKKIISNI